MATQAAGIAGIRPSSILALSTRLTPSYLLNSASEMAPRDQSIRIKSDRPRPTRAYTRRTHSPSMPVQVRSFHRSSSRRSAESSAIPHISFHIAASSSGKGSKFRPEKSTFDFEPDHTDALGVQRDDHSIFQKRRARPDSGQDAYFVAKVGQNTGETAFGICDGVGGWTDHGIDPADFSHGLCSHMATTALNWPAPGHENKRLKPQELLEFGYQGTTKDPQIKAGGSTACVGIADGEGRMRIANLGDSGFVLLRLGTVQHYSNPQTHAFNTPFQMSLTPPEILAQAMIFGGLPLNDLPERADLADHQLEHGDIVVLATDGVWDNLSSQDILALVSNIMRNVGVWQRTSDRGYVVTDKLEKLVGKDHAASESSTTGTLQSIIAASIVGEAKSASLNRKRDGPFAKAWQLQMPYDAYHGGKVDDIAAVVLILVDNERPNKQLKAKL